MIPFNFGLKTPALEIFKAREYFRFRTAICGRRFGKTSLGGLESVEECKEKNKTVWYIAPTYKQARLVIWDHIKELVPRSFLRKKPNESNLTLSFWSGSNYSLKGSDDADSLRGPVSGLHFVHIDEISKIKNVKTSLWEKVIRPQLTTTKGRALFTGTSEGFNEAYDLYALGLNSVNRDYKSFIFTSAEGGWIDAEEIEAAKKTMDPKTFEQEFFAKFITLTGRVYYAFDRVKNTRPLPDNLRDVPWSAGMDFNVDPMSCRVFVEDSQNTYFCGEISIRNSNTEEMAQELKRKFPQVKTIYPDPAGGARKTSAKIGESDLAILKQHGYILKYHHRTDSVKDGINAVNARLCSASGERHLFVTPDLKQTPEDLEKHLWKQGASIPENDNYVHGGDCIRYPTEFLHGLNKFERKYINA